MASVAAPTPDGATYSTSAKEVANTGGSKQLTSIDIEVASNDGFMVTCRHRMKNTSKGGDIGYVEPDKYAFSNTKELFAFLSDKLGGADDTSTESASQGASDGDGDEQA